MTIYIKDPATDKAVRKLARLKGVTLTEAIRGAIEKDLAAEQAKKSEDFMDGIRELQAKLAKYPRTGLKADKAFYDWLSGEE